MKKKKNKKTIPQKIVKFFLVFFIILFILMTAFFTYTQIYYHPTDSVVSYLEDSNTVDVSVNDSYIEFKPINNPTKAIVFYPGGKVDEKAYAPLMNKLADKGYLCIIVRMPFRLAMFNMNYMDKLYSKYSNIDEWYLAGHSLGGAMGSIYASKNSDKLEGVILLGAYSTKKLDNVKVLAIRGSNDLVMKKSTYDKYRSNLPTDTLEYVIEGGCHAYYGMYGAQKGDGTPTISNVEQIDIVVVQIDQFISKE